YKQSDITDIFVDRYDKINVMRRGVLEKTDCAFNSEEALVSLIEQLRKTLNQDFGLNAPILDARLPDGSRLNCTHVSVTPQGSSMS
ncbi:ATPase, T2SS/T4P/T4SS family, partial [Klebsiella pneumoniae]